MGRVRGRRSIVAVATIFGLAFLGSPVRAAGQSYVVTSLADTTADDGACTLREAILAANNAAANDDCGPASPNDDTITFSVSGTITLGSTLPSIAGGGLAIDGGGTITVSGDGKGRVLETDSDADVTLENITISGGLGSLGGGIYNAGVLTVTGSTISGNEVTGFSRGGGIYNADTGTLRVTRSTISRNVASSNGGTGGGIYNLGMLTVTSSTISENGATDGGSGGGIYNAGGTVTVINSTISGNSATAVGGGIDAGGTVTVINSTISGNFVRDTYARGGGIAFASGSLMIINATIALNSVIGEQARDAGIWASGDTSVFFKNSIVALNQGYGDENCSSVPIGASGTNFDTDGSCGVGFTQVTAAALNLGSLADNGGPTRTHALQSGSVAIDAASDCTLPNGAPVTTDQRGVARPQDGDGDSSAVCDVGAYEVEAAATASPSPSPAASPSASPAGTATAPVTPPATDATRLAASTESSLLVAGLIVLAAVALGVGFLVPTWARRIRPARRR
jgi:CSLREA domain-containing protein